MRLLSEYTRQTRWAHPPEAQVEPVTARAVVWAPCAHCDLQVHAFAAAVARDGLACPDCGGRLLPPGGDEAAVKAADALLAASARELL